MNLKISLGAAIAIMLMVAAGVFSATMVYSEHQFNLKSTDLERSREMYAKFTEVDRTVRENFDGTITSVPAYALMNDAFINWRGVSDSGCRRIKRAIHIDATGIKYLEDGTTTNLTRFREYVSGYLKEHPRIRHDLTMLVRQLDSDGRGVPLEVYAFADTSAFDEYELIQSSIFEHLYAKIPDFGLRVYQWPGEQE